MEAVVKKGSKLDPIIDINFDLVNFGDLLLVVMVKERELKINGLIASNRFHLSLIKFPLEPFNSYGQLLDYSKQAGKQKYDCVSIKIHNLFTADHLL